MSEAIAVLLGGRVAGTVTRLPGGRLRFDYDEQYRSTPDATPLSISMPTSVASHSDGLISPWLWGLLPDNPRVLARWAREFHVSAQPFSLLSTPIGRDCAGAIRLVPIEDAAGSLADKGSVAWLAQEQIAQRLLELREDNTAWLGRDFTGQFSLAGAQAKTALLYRNRRWGVPSGAQATSHILKPALEGFDDHDLNEHLCLDAARRAGLIAARTRVERFASESAIVVARYDRRSEHGKLVRIHQEDICQALGVHPDRKYQNEGGPGASEIVRLLRTAMGPRQAEESVWRFFDALVWNWLIAGTDAHAKNYSLLLSDTEVQLAPLYDIASALPYGTHERELRFAMKIGGDYRVHLERNTWPKAARELNLDIDEVTGRVIELAARAPDAFADAAKSPEVKALGRPLPDRLLDLVVSRVNRCRTLMQAPARSTAKRA